MMLGSRQVNNNMYSSTNSARKENMPLSPSEMAQTVTFSTLYPNHPQSKIMQSQRVYTTNKPVSPIRLGSPREMVNGGVSGQRRIQLGGSKDRQMSRQKAISIVSNQVRMGDQSTNENLLRKVSMLESRVKELHMEKQYLAVQLNQRIRQLEQENNKLISMVKESDCKGSELKQNDGNTEADKNEEEFNLEDELANQINVNLELREQLDKFIEEVKSCKDKEQKQVQEINNLEDERAHFKLQLLQNHDQIEGLKEKIESLEESLAKKDENTTHIVEEKEKRILQLEDENFTLCHKIQEKEQHIQTLSNENAFLKENNETITSETEKLRSKVSELQKPIDCKKCKDLLHTVFRLNCQLNRK